MTISHKSELIRGQVMSMKDQLPAETALTDAEKASLLLLAVELDDLCGRIELLTEGK